MCVNGVTAFPMLSLIICPSLIKGTVVYNVGYFYAKAEEISLHHPSVGFRSSSKQWTGMAILGKVRRVFKNLQSLGKPKAAGKTEQRLFVLKNLYLINTNMPIQINKVASVAGHSKII